MTHENEEKTLGRSPHALSRPGHSSSMDSGHRQTASRQPRRGRTLPTLQDVHEDLGMSNDGESSDNWLGKEQAESPKGDPSPQEPSFRSDSPTFDRIARSVQSRLNSRRPTPLADSTAALSDSLLPSPSGTRWESLRRHVLPPPTQLPESSTSSLSLPLPPTRSQTPKPSRFARLGFRQVVDHAREVVVDDTRRLAHEIQKACWSARASDASKSKGDRDRDPTAGTMGSSLHLPFMASSTLPPGAAASASMNSSSRWPDIRRPQSMQSLSSSYKSPPSIKQLYQLLIYCSTRTADGLALSKLPHEAQVLSTLMIPFYSFEEGSRIEEERWSALEGFDAIVRVWSPSDELEGVDRCIWCCKVALLSRSRTRIIKSLWNLVVPQATRILVTTPQSLREISQWLFLLLSSLHVAPANSLEQGELELAEECVTEVCSSNYSELDTGAIEEEYNGIFLEADEISTIKKLIILEALAVCLENCPEEIAWWLIHNTIQHHWPEPQGLSLSPLSTAILTRALHAFCRVSLALISNSSSAKSSKKNMNIIVRLIRLLAIPTIDVIDGKTVVESQVLVIRIVMELLSGDASKTLDWAQEQLSYWYRHSSGWKTSIEKCLKTFVAQGEWSNIPTLLLTLMQSQPEDIRKQMVIFFLPLVVDRLVEDPPSFPHITVTTLLDTVSRLYPSIFYKPLFACATSTKEFSVVNHLCSITAVSRFLPDYWTRDAEMMSVALMNDPTGTRAALGTRPAWGIARLGQSILLLEIIGRLQAARRMKEQSPSSDGPFIDTAKFVLGLELRLGLLLEAKEQVALIPYSQRLLFCVLFREIRLLTRSLKAAPWLARVLTWFTDYHIGHDTNDEELTTSVTQIQGLYEAARDGIRSSHKRRTTMMFSTVDEKAQTDGPDTAPDISSTFVERTRLVESLLKGFSSRAMKLLTSMSTLLTPADYLRLAPILWDEDFHEFDSSTTTSVCYLLMQCAEKAPLDLSAIIEVDLRSSDRLTKLNAVEKLSTLSNWRFQIMSQHIVVDRAHRPFKLARGPLPFVATDMGSNQFVLDEASDDLIKDTVPLELRRRLAEIGWADDDAPINERLEWIKTPMSIIPIHQLSRLEGLTTEHHSLPADNSAPGSPNLANSGERPEDGGLLRRNSSSGGPAYNMKRRAVFVPSLAGIFQRLAHLVFDENFYVASAARVTILDLMRNDPALLTRPVLDHFVGEEKDLPSAISTLEAFLHLRHLLPPPMTHHLFNNLAGFLKFIVRQVDNSDALSEYSLTIPALARLITQVNGMSIREIRRAKLEAFLIPSGSLWFSPSGPMSSMFPTEPEVNHNPFDGLPPSLVSMTMIRTAQNLLFVSMLKRNSQDVQLIRKNMTRVVLPSLDNSLDDANLDLKDFMPQPSSMSVRDDPALTALSLMFSRSYLLLVAEVFRSMSRHLNDRNELAVLVDGLNRVLLKHGDDIGIVSQALIALMVASTRFRRLFTSGGGYTLFMPVVVKTYAESEAHPGIRLAIEYAANRFYALHREAFVFQSLDIISHVLMLRGMNAEWFAKNIYHLFFTLRSNIPPTVPDAAGIHNANRRQEKEALIVTTAEEKPQTFLTLLRHRDTQGRNQFTIDLPEEYEASRLRIDNFIRLFLTVIAHDPSISRAEYFLHTLRFLAPYLYHSSASARSVLQEGIDALGQVLSKASTKMKPTDPTTRSTNDVGETLSSLILEDQLFDKSKTASEPTSMRINYLALVVAFTKAGGQITPSAFIRLIDFIKGVLKDSSGDLNEQVSLFFTDFAGASLLSESPPDLDIVNSRLRAFGSIINIYSTALDFTGVFEVVSKLADMDRYSSNPSFAQIVVSQICAAGLSGGELAASEKRLFTLSYRSSLVTLLARSISLKYADVLPEIEKRAPSYEFLLGIVLPMVMTLRTDADSKADGTRIEPWLEKNLASAWMRLLSYTLSACQPNQRSVGPGLIQERGKSRSTQLQQSERTRAAALQVLKAIITRAGAELTTCLPGVWNRVASMLRKNLAEGSAFFSMGRKDYSPVHSPFHSPFHSPLPSPRASGQFDPFQLSMTSGHLDGLRVEALTLQSPRIIDYMLWSILELLCVYRNPLTLQMRLFMVEKVVELDQHLQVHHNTLTPSSSASARRTSAAVFSKPRRRTSGLPSPDVSPRLSASQSSPHFPPSPILDGGRRAGYQNISPSPSSFDFQGPRIVHLGPISHPSSSPFRGSISPGGINTHPATKSTKIRSLALIKKTYHRIRLVQTYLGYDTLLPMPQQPDVDELQKVTWTRRQALDAIVVETKELIEEFEESMRDIENDLIADIELSPLG